MPRFSLTPGEVFAADYEVIDRLGEGGFGSVWRVRQRSTGRVRALKILHAEALVDEDARARFAAEATASARIESEHVVQVLQAGVEPDGTPWLAMELLEGSTLAEFVARHGPLDFAGAAELGRQVAHALDAAHRVGVVHRDLKPENVFIAESRRADAARTVKLLDFGIAKVLGDARRSTAASGILGTALWMAPEQFEQRVSPAVDVWTFGLLVYFALVGRPYWDAAAQSLFAVLDEVRQERRDPSARARRQAGRALPEGFDAWFARCTALDPRRRFVRAGEAHAALVALARATAPTLAAPTLLAQRPAAPPAAETPVRFEASAPTERLRPPRRWPRVLGAGVLAAAVAAATLPWLAPRATRTDALPLPAQPEAPRSPFARCPSGMTFVAGGRVTLGTRAPYAVPGYCLDRTEVTAREYAACAAARRCAAVTERIRAGLLDNVCTATRAGFEAHPINCVTAGEAEAYCAWRGARLPTSPEWELAATGPDGARAYPWGDEPVTGARANTCGVECAERTGTARETPGVDDYPTTAPAGALRDGASPDGVLDLGGNVAEWVATGPWDFNDGKRTSRGAHWGDPPVRSRLAVRRVAPGYRGRSIGVRCAADAR